MKFLTWLGSGSKLRRILRAALLLLLVIALGSSLLVLVYMMPTGKVASHVKSSLAVFEKHYTWERMIQSVETTRLDHYTDAIMLGEAYCSTGDDPIRSAFTNSYPYSDEGNADDWLIRYIKHDESVDTASYSRYWNGYLIVLKPLLYFMNYQSIILLNYVLQGLLCLALLALAYRKHGFPLAFGLLCSLLFLTCFVIPSAMQYSWVFYVTILSSLLAIACGKQFEKANVWIFVFLLIGAITSYIDMLTFPTIALCIPLACALFSVPRNRRVVVTISSSISWGFGYAIMWASKWVLSSLVLGTNDLPIEQLVMRSSASANNQAITILDVFKINIGVFDNIVYYLCLALEAITLIAFIIANRSRLRFDSLSALPFLFIALIPVVWLCVTQNHAFVHFWMTYRNLAVIPMLIVLFFTSLLLNPRKD